MSSNTSKPVITWLEIIQVIGAKTQDDYQKKVVPAVKTGRSRLGTLLVQIGNRIQPK